MKKLILCLTAGLMTLSSCATLGMVESVKLNKEILEAIKIQNEKLLTQNSEYETLNQFYRLFLDEVERLYIINSPTAAATTSPTTTPPATKPPIPTTISPTTTPPATKPPIPTRPIPAQLQRLNRQAQQLLIQLQRLNHQIQQLLA
jgi:hypothetical protein